MIESSSRVLLFSPANELKRLIALVEQVINHATRRVIDGQSVPTEDNVVSLFKPHTDIIEKYRPDTFYGNKICLSVGPSNPIKDCLVVKGDPADATLMDQCSIVMIRFMATIRLKLPWIRALHQKRAFGLPPFCGLLEEFRIQLANHPPWLPLWEASYRIV